MIHYKDPKTMAKVACKAISPQAESARPLAVDCPHCKASEVYQLALLADAAASASASLRRFANAAAQRPSGSLTTAAAVAGYSGTPGSTETC